MITVENLNYRYQDEYILKNIGFTIDKNEFVVIVGPRGEGKSTLLKLLAGLFLPEEGDVFYSGVNLRRIPKKELMDIHRRTAFVFQDAALISNMKVFDNLALPLRYREVYPEEEIRKIVSLMLREVNLENVRNLLPAFVSMGQRRILATLRALVVTPETVFYDEPLANLDRPSRSLMKDLIRETLKRSVTSVVVTHEFAEFEPFITKVLVLRDRTLYKTGTLQQIRDSEDPYIRSLIC